MALTTLEPSLTRFLLDYWRSHPKACDTTEGIQRWWLPEDYVASLSEIGSALNWLVEEKIIEIVRIGDRSALYRRRADATDEDIVVIAETLNGATKQGGL